MLKIKNIYEKIYNKDNLIDLPSNIRLLKMHKILESLNLNDKYILDIGCHDGSLLSTIKAGKKFGLEADEYAAEKAKAKTKGIEVNRFYINGEEKLPYEDNWFDVVIAGEIIEHIYDTNMFLKEINRILKKDGLLLITTPNIASIERRIFLFLGKNPLLETSVSGG